MLLLPLRRLQIAPRLSFQLINTAPTSKRTFIPLSVAGSALSALSALTSSSSGKPQHYHAERTLSYPKTFLYNVVSDIESYPQFLPLVTNAKILDWAGGGSHGYNGEANEKASTDVKRTEKSSRLPAIASLKFGLPEGSEMLVLKGRTTASFTSNIYCAPSRGLVEAVAGEERSSQSLSAEELHRYGYTNYNNGNVPQQQQQQQQQEDKDMGPQLFRVCRTQWLLSQIGKDKTEVDLRIEVEWKNVIYAGIMQAAAPKIADMMIEAFEKRARDTFPG